jgi:hypothetical protein
MIYPATNLSAEEELKNHLKYPQYDKIAQFWKTQFL